MKSWQEWEATPSVRGHLCEGLRRGQKAGGGCKPRYNEKGSLSGCDDINYVPILFCPYCGERIPIEWDEYESEWSTSEYIDAATGESHHGVAGYDN